MPSDPSGANPKGVLTRPAPDFFDDHLASGAFFVSEPVPGDDFNYCTVALFNNANSGVVFKVYAVTAINDGGSGMGLFWVHGTLGALVQNCQPIRPDVGSPYGQIYQQTASSNVSTFPNPFFSTPPATIFAANGFDSATHLAQFPLFIVPVGWSAVLSNLTASIDLGAAFWYQVANE